MKFFMDFKQKYLNVTPQTPVDTEDVQPAPNIDHLLSNIGRTLGEASGESP